MHLNDLRIIEKVVLFSKNGGRGFSNERSRRRRRRDDDGSWLRVLDLTRYQVGMREGIGTRRVEVAVGVGDELSLRFRIEGSRRGTMERSEVLVLVLVLMLILVLVFGRMESLWLKRERMMNLVLEGVLLLMLLLKVRWVASDEGSKREIVRSTFRIEKLLLLMLRGRVERRSLVEERSTAGSHRVVEADRRRDLGTKTTERERMSVCY